MIGRNRQRHRHQEFIRFLNVIEKQVPVGKTVHAIVGNHAAHKHPNVRRWLERHPRWTLHFTPTSASWLNAVEGFFATLTKRRLQRGLFRSVADLQAAIDRFLEEHNQQSDEPLRVDRRLFRLKSRGHGWLIQHGVVALLGFGRRDVADGLQQPAIVEPVDPFERGELDGLA